MSVEQPGPAPHPESLEGRTFKIVWPASPHATYVTISDVIEDGKRRPFEMFINSRNMEHYAWTVALTRMILAVFRRGGDISFVADELKAIFDPRGGEWIHGQYVPSLLAAIGDVVERHLHDLRDVPARHGTDSSMTLTASRPSDGETGHMSSEL